MMVMDTILGFEWDEGNMAKVETRGFTVGDVERTFLNGRGTLFPDLGHSQGEDRYWLIGITDDGRHVTVPFTVRTQRIRTDYCVDYGAQAQEVGAMKKEKNEAEYLESQADRLERFVDFNRPGPAVFPNLKPSTARVTLRMPGWLLAELKREANRRDVPYQSLLKMVLADWLRGQSAA